MTEEEALQKIRDLDVPEVVYCEDAARYIEKVIDLINQADTDS